MTLIYANHQAQYQSDVWTLFDYLVLGYDVVQVQYQIGPRLWCKKPSSELESHKLDINVANPLLNLLLVEKIDAKDMQEEAVYKITEKGKQVFEELKTQTNSVENQNLEMQKLFRDKFEIKRPKK